MHEEDDEGPDGNARLTGAIGMVLLVVLFVEGITILQIHQLITLHVFLGLLLIPPTALKVASTVYRFVRYYRHSPSYVRRGPPPPLLRWTAPLLIIFTAAVLATGVALIAVEPGQPRLLLTAHQFSFVIWFALMTLHVLGHVKEAAVLSWRDWRPRASRPQLRGKRQRGGLVAISIIAGVVLGTALLPVASSWTTGRNFGSRTRHNGESQVGQSPHSPFQKVAASSPVGRRTTNMGEFGWP